MTPKNRKEAELLDETDPLRAARDHFDLPDGVIYLDGNSLGPPPKGAIERMRKVVEHEWRRDLIKSWNDAGWIDLSKTCGAKIAPLIGAEPDEVIVCDSVSVNIFKLTCALMETGSGAIAYELGEFPTDGYILQGLAALTNIPLKKIAPSDPEEALSQDISVYIKSLVHYKSAAITDISKWEEIAAQRDIKIIWDLSHAAGLIDFNLKRSGASYAVGCGYKFLNGGPGAPAFIFVDNSKSKKMSQPLSGWMGHASPFEFADEYTPADGVARFACGTPPILSLSALDAALDVFAGVDMAKVEQKAKLLGDLFLERAITLELKPLEQDFAPRRGGHISLHHNNGLAIVQALISRGVIGDFRAPDLMRFGFSPLFLSYAEVWDSVDALADILSTEEWRNPEYMKRKKVT